ncbi:FkbM family methyltransferase [Methylacidimicrobium tartarophylax]|uniref:Methyltransferase FkbM domain-containing protein n=1 Tax=Methylacidimicrobium tartarophylax TaxID=1041768 RepID=A0A5E6MBK2_9BACT|nr:FkbM family methyltransferase [Methylacidimicrobium tartarophylax]VVM06579.1 hypothetical protein MAMT_01291 [Methylacidimicrobium tartarophylax]
MTETRPIVSYARHYEDIRLLRSLPGVGRGFYVDVGANDPTLDSVTRAFHERGWRGIHVEPLPHQAERLRLARPGDVVLQAALSDAPGEAIFYDVDGRGLSTLNADLAEHWRAKGLAVRKEMVPVTTLPEVLKHCTSQEIHFLKIDAKGSEERILSAYDFQTGPRPWILLVEASDPGSADPAYLAWEPRLLASHYSFACEDPANRYYVANEHLEVLERLRRPLSLLGVVRRGEAEAIARARLLEERARLLEAECARLRSEAHPRPGTFRRLEKSFRLWRREIFGNSAGTPSAVLDPRRSAPLLLGIRITGGVGDSVVVARFLRDMAHWLDGKVCFRIRPSGPRNIGFLFSALPEALLDSEPEEAREAADAELTINQFIFLNPEQVSWEAVGRKSSAFLRWVAEAEERAKEIAKYRERHPFLDGAHANLAALRGIRRENSLHAQCGIPYGGPLFPLALPAEVPAASGLEPGTYLTLHDGWDPHFPIDGPRPTKAYPPERWGELAKKLRERIPGICLVQIGGEASPPIVGVDWDLRGKTTLAESVAILAGARLHVDSESGLVHLASCVGTRCAVLFGPTNIDFFGYPGNINIPPQVCGNCWWSTDSWMSRCPRGLPGSPCMESIDPTRVAEAIATALALPRRARAGHRSSAATEAIDAA